MVKSRSKILMYINTPHCLTSFAVIFLNSRKLVFLLHESLFSQTAAGRQDDSTLAWSVVGYVFVHDYDVTLVLGFLYSAAMFSFAAVDAIVIRRVIEGDKFNRLTGERTTGEKKKKEVREIGRTDETHCGQGNKLWCGSPNLCCAVKSRTLSILPLALLSPLLKCILSFK